MSLFLLQSLSDDDDDDNDGCNTNVGSSCCTTGSITGAGSDTDAGT